MCSNFSRYVSGRGLVHIIFTLVNYENRYLEILIAWLFSYVFSSITFFEIFVLSEAVRGGVGVSLIFASRGSGNCA